MGSEMCIRDRGKRIVLEKTEASDVVKSQEMSLINGFKLVFFPDIFLRSRISVVAFGSEPVNQCL